MAPPLALRLLFHQVTKPFSAAAGPAANRHVAAAGRPSRRLRRSGSAVCCCVCGVKLHWMRTARPLLMHLLQVRCLAALPKALPAADFCSIASWRSRCGPVRSWQSSDQGDAELEHSAGKTLCPDFLNAEPDLITKPQRCSKRARRLRPYTCFTRAVAAFPSALPPGRVEFSPSLFAAVQWPRRRATTAKAMLPAWKPCLVAQMMQHQ